MANPLEDIRTSLNTSIKSFPKPPGITAELPELPAIPGVASLPALPAMPMAAGAGAPVNLADMLPKIPGLGAVSPSQVGPFPGIPAASTYVESQQAAKKIESLRSANRSPPTSGIPHGEYMY